MGETTRSSEAYAPLHVHSHYSLLDGLPSPKRIIERCKELGLPACAITDHGNLFGMMAFYNAAKKVGIKPIIGIELYICQYDPTIKTPENKDRTHLTVLAKNQEGIETLMRLVSECNRPDYFYHKPRIDMKHLAPFGQAGDLLCLSGCLAGRLSTSLFVDLDEACKISSHTEDPGAVRQLLKPNWADIAAQVVAEHQSIFGADNFFLEIQDEGMAVQRVVMDCLRTLGPDLKVPTVATLDAHYCRQEDALDQRILLYSQMHTTQEEQDALKQQGGDTMHFFHSDTFHIYSPAEMFEHYTGAEVQRTLEIADRVKMPKLGRKPCLPKFTDDHMGGRSSEEYLLHLCVEGAKKKLAHLPPEKKKVYWARVQYELMILNDAKLADYFLIEWDACRFVDKLNGPRGKGRGSGAGCLVNYLLGITGIDPLQYDLLFERFYNPSRNIPPHFNIGDCDFMKWLGENFERAIKADKKEPRLTVSRTAKRRTKLLVEEAQWIDENNPKMWVYLADAIKNGVKDPENKANSHIAYGLGLTDKLDESKPVQTVAGHTALPDIDTDIGVVFRAKVIDYLNHRWGEDRVAQMVTFGRLQGKAALKEVFRAQPETVKQMMKVRALKLGKKPEEVVQKPFDLCNEITEYIPDEAAINDELQQIRKERDDESYGVLQWAIEHVDQVREFYKWYKPLFDQAMRIEGTRKSQSKHAAGVVIADRPVAELLPMVYDTKTKARICGLEMTQVEALGGVKYDFLGVTALDKIHYASQLINQHGAAPLIDEEPEAEEENAEAEVEA